jgi:aldose 1-epimerase
VNNAINGRPGPPDEFAPARVLQLSNAAGLQVTVMDHGATWLSCSLPLPDGSRREVVLGCSSLAEYQRQPLYVGATIGRFTNRIRDARFEVDGRLCLLTPNNGPHQLHGGPEGFDRKVWEIAHVEPTAVTFSLVSPDGDQGYPGRLHARIRYALLDDLSLETSCVASVSAPCPVGLTQHPYFNLNGDQGGATASCLDHHLRVDAPCWLPLDDQFVAVAGLSSVAGTGLDLRQARQLRQAIASDPFLRDRNGIDCSLSLASTLRDGAAVAAELTASDGRVRLQLQTDQPALQVYTGNGLAGVRARDGRPYRQHAGIALEPQFIPNSPNRPVAQPYWPDCILRPGQLRRSRTIWRFITC